MHLELFSTLLNVSTMIQHFLEKSLYPILLFAFLQFAPEPLGVES